MTAVTHIASDHITINDRFLRQRCGWCGESLINVDTARMAVPIGQEGPYPTWPVGGLVLMDGPMSCYVNLEGRLPENFCGAEQMKAAKGEPTEVEAMEAEGQTIAANAEEPEEPEEPEEHDEAWWDSYADSSASAAFDAEETGG